MNTHNKPLAAAALLSYRYRGRYGWIMIGAKDNDDALLQAQQSTDEAVTSDRLQFWNGTEYEQVI